MSQDTQFTTYYPIIHDIKSNIQLSYNTDILVNSKYNKKIQHLTINDYIINDKLKAVRITELYKTYNFKYEIIDINNNFVMEVGENHMLRLLLVNEKKMIKNDNSFCITWISNKTLKYNNIKFVFNNKNYQRIYKNATEFYNKLRINIFINISVYKYLKLPENIKSNLYLYSTLISYDNYYTLSDPYIMGGMYGINTIVDNNYIVNINDYKYNSSYHRLLFLAGIFDAYGSQLNNKYILNLQSLCVISHIIFIIKSLNLEYTLTNEELILDADLPSKIYNYNKNIKLSKYRPFKFTIKKISNIKTALFGFLTEDNSNCIINTNVISG